MSADSTADTTEALSAEDREWMDAPLGPRHPEPDTTDWLAAIEARTDNARYLYTTDPTLYAKAPGDIERLLARVRELERLYAEQTAGFRRWSGHMDECDYDDHRVELTPEQRDVGPYGSLLAEVRRLRAALEIAERDAQRWREITAEPWREDDEALEGGA